MEPSVNDHNSRDMVPQTDCASSTRRQAATSSPSSLSPWPKAPLRRGKDKGITWRVIAKMAKQRKPKDQISRSIRPIHCQHVLLGMTQPELRSRERWGSIFCSHPPTTSNIARVTHGRLMFGIQSTYNNNLAKTVRQFRTRFLFVKNKITDCLDSDILVTFPHNKKTKIQPNKDT